MAKASNVFLVLGAIGDILLAVIFLVLAILSGVGGGMIGGDEGLISGGIGAIVFGILCAWEIIVFCIAVAAYKAHKKPGAQNGPFIFLIIFGFLSGNLCYILGSIFGLISESKEE